MTKNTKVNAAILIIGNEILSGRTQDINVVNISKWFTQILFRVFRLPINHSMAKLQCFLQKLKQAFPTHHLQYPCQAMSLRQQEHPSQLYLCIIQLPKVGYLRFIKVRKLNIQAQIIANMLCDHQGLHPQQLLARISLLPKR